MEHPNINIAINSIVFDFLAKGEPIHIESIGTLVSRHCIIRNQYNAKIMKRVIVINNDKEGTELKQLMRRLADKYRVDVDRMFNNWYAKSLIENNSKIVYFSIQDVVNIIVDKTAKTIEITASEELQEFLNPMQEPAFKSYNNNNNNDIFMNYEQSQPKYREQQSQQDTNNSYVYNTHSYQNERQGHEREVVNNNINFNGECNGGYSYDNENEESSFIGYFIIALLIVFVAAGVLVYNKFNTKAYNNIDAEKSEMHSNDTFIQNGAIINSEYAEIGYDIDYKENYNVSSTEVIEHREIPNNRHFLVVGSFHELNNAKAKSEEIEQDGYEAYIGNYGNFNIVMILLQGNKCSMPREWDLRNKHRDSWYYFSE